MASVGRTTAVSGGTGTQSTPANNIGGGGSSSGEPRRASQSGLFSGLVNQKRNSQDATATARRESFADQKPQAGIIGNMWNKFTTGSSPPK